MSYYGEPVRTFTSGRFQVVAFMRENFEYEYDGDDTDGEVQGKLDSGEYVAFDSSVVVYLDGREIASDNLGGSVYGADEWRDFFTAHRDPDPMKRNCTIQKEATGYLIGHYFPDMVRAAVREARDAVRAMPAPPRMRDAA